MEQLPLRLCIFVPRIGDGAGELGANGVGVAVGVWVLSWPLWSFLSRAFVGGFMSTKSPSLCFPGFPPVGRSVSSANPGFSRTILMKSNGNSHCDVPVCITSHHTISHLITEYITSLLPCTWTQASMNTAWGVSSTMPSSVQCALTGCTTVGATHLSRA